MKRIIALVFILLISCQTIFKLAFITYWQFNRTQIINKYCENKAKPQLHCNGKCYLKKQLKKADSNTDNNKQQLPLELLKFKFTETFYEATNSFQQPISWFDNTKIIFSNLMVNHYLAGFKSPLLKPPI